MPKKKATAVPAVAAVAAPPAAGASAVESAVAITPAEAKKLAKLLKASDRGKRLDAIRVVSENHGYLSTGGCLLPLVESLVAKKKTEEVVKAAGQVIVDFLVGRGGGDPTLASETTLVAMQEAKKKPSKFKLAETLGNLVLSSDHENSWNAVRSLRSMAATWVSLPSNTPKAAAVGAILLGQGHPADRLCSHFVAQETQRVNDDEGSKESAGAGEAGTDSIFPWAVVRVCMIETIGVMCGIGEGTIQTVVDTGAVPFLLRVLRSVTESECPDQRLLTATLVVLFAVAKAGAGREKGAAGDATAGRGTLMGATRTAAATSSGAHSPELAALAKGGAWGAVYDALKGPCMAHAVELQSGAATKTGGKKGGAEKIEHSVSPALAACLDNMARCAEVLRVMAMTGAGLEEEGALEAGIAAMSSILGMHGLPREQAAVANLMAGMVKAMGSIACLSEGNRVKVCSAGAAAKVLGLMSLSKRHLIPGGTTGGATTQPEDDTSPPDTPHGRLMRKTAEKCLHHLVVSRITWMADDRALCDTTERLTSDTLVAEVDPTPTTEQGGGGRVQPGAPTDNRRSSSADSNKRRRRSSGSNGSRRWEAASHILPTLGPAYLTVEAVLAAANADCIDVRCRAVRLLSRLVSSRSCASALGVSAIPAMKRLIAWWLRTKDNPEAHRTPRPPDAAILEGSNGKSPAGPTAGGKKAKAGAGAVAPVTEIVNGDIPVDDAALAAARLTAERMEEADSTRVLRDEALAYALRIMLELADTGQDERAAIGEDCVVELLVNVLKSLPCTTEEFCRGWGVRRRSTAGTGKFTNDSAETHSNGTATTAATGTSQPSGAGSAFAIVAGKDGGSVGDDSGGAQYAVPEVSRRQSVDVNPSSKQASSSPGPVTKLDLSSTRAQHSVESPRRICCWRGQQSRDPAIALFSPLDWGWDFKVGAFQEPVQPGMVLRAATLRVLLAVVNGYDPSVDAASAAVGAASTTTAKGGAAAAAAAEVASGKDAMSGANGARSVLKYALAVCFDLLSVDVRHGDAVEDGMYDTRENVNGATESSREQIAGRTKASVHQQLGIQSGEKLTESTIETLLGLPVSPPEELVHEEILVASLRLVGALLRLGAVAREAMLCIADTHRNRWRAFLEDSTSPPLEPVEVRSKPPKPGSAAADKESLPLKSLWNPWCKPETFRKWNIRAGGDLHSLIEALPYIRTLSILLLPLRHPDAPITNIMAALVALGRLCRESEYETGGTQPEAPLTLNDDNPPPPLRGEATTGVLVDTLAGVAVGVGTLVPLVSIWGCAVAAAGSDELPPETSGMVHECQTLIDYFIRRGHAREMFWSSLFSLDQIAEAKAAAVEAATPKKKDPRKSKTGKGKGSDKASSVEVPLGNEDDGQPLRPPRPVLPDGRQDPNGGPDRVAWAQLLNARVDEQRTQTLGTTALLMAAVTGLETAVTNLLVAGADPNISGKDGRSPLMCVLAQGMDEVVHKLVQAGANVDAVDAQGCNVLKCAFLCPSRQAMTKIVRNSSDGRGVNAPAGDSSVAGMVGDGYLISNRRASTARTDPSPMDGGDGLQLGRPRSRTRKSLSSSRSRNRSGSGSFVKQRRRSSPSYAGFFGEAGGTASANTAGSSGRRRRSSRTPSLSAVDSARAAMRASAHFEPTQTLKTPRGISLVKGDARMVPYIIACGADPNVSSGTGDFPLHWAVIGTELTVRIMNQRVKIVVAPDGGGEVNEENTFSGDTNTQAAANGGAESKKTGDCGSGTAAREKHSALLRSLLDAGSSVDVCTPDGFTALHAAVIGGGANLAGALLDAGASPNISDSLGCLPLHYACLRATEGYADLAGRLLSLGMGRRLEEGVHLDLRKGKTKREKLLLDVSDIMRSGLREATAPSCITQRRAVCSELLNFVSREGYTPLLYVCDGRVASRQAASTLLARLRERSPAPRALLRSSSSSGDILRDALDNSGIGVGGASGVFEGSLDRVAILRWLLSQSDIDLNARVPRGTTALHLAAQVPGPQGADLVRLLVQTRELSIDALDAPVVAMESVEHRKRNISNTSLMCSPGASSPAKICPKQEAGESSGSKAGTPLRFSALHYALQAGSWDVARILLSAGASARPDGAFPPCLHVACLAGAPVPLVQLLLDRGGGSAIELVGEPPLLLDHNPCHVAITSDAATPLFLAATAGNEELIVFLLSTVETGVQARDHTAAKVITMGDQDTGEHVNLTNSNVATSMWTITHSPSDGRSPMHAAALTGNAAVVRALLDVEPLSIFDRPSSSWVNGRDASGRTPLEMAVSVGKWECAEALASAKSFDVRLAVDGGPSSVLTAIELANMRIVDESMRNTWGLSALRESNKLVMTILARLSQIAKECSTEAMAGPLVTAVAIEGSSPDAIATTEAKYSALDDADEQHRIPGVLPAGQQHASEAASTANGHDRENSATLIASSSLPVIYHAHPCFGDGVLYSNTKGISTPETPGRTRRWSSDRNGQRGTGAADEAADAKRHRAAKIIQSRARRAAVAKKGGVVKARRNSHPSVGQRTGGVSGRSGHAAAVEQEEQRAAVVIQSQARRVKAKSDAVRRHEELLRRNNAKRGEVGAVVITKVPTERHIAPAPMAGGGG